MKTKVAGGWLLRDVLPAAVHGGTRQRLAQKNAVSYAVQVMQKMGDQEEVRPGSLASSTNGRIFF